MWLRSQDSNLAHVLHALGLTVRGFRLATTSGICISICNIEYCLVERVGIEPTCAEAPRGYSPLEHHCSIRSLLLEDLVGLEPNITRMKIWYPNL